MASPPQLPETSHKKDISAVSVRTIGREIGDEGQRGLEDQPAGRRRLGPLSLKTHLGRPRHGVELIPKPSGDARDPLNWAQWKKESAFGSLLLGTATLSILKTLFIPTTSVLSTQFNISYTSATTLTGLPFIFAAFSAVGTTILSQIIGKRSILIVASVGILVGALWNMHVGDSESYAQFLVARCLQGFGWGAFEALILPSIDDLYFVHERTTRRNMYQATSILFTWSPPILIGYLEQSTTGFGSPIMILTIIQAFSILFIVLLVPETSFSRSSDISLSNAAPRTALQSYVQTLHPLPYTAPLSTQHALKPIRALATPTAILLSLSTFPIIASAYALANSLPLLFAAMPTFLFPGRLGYLFIGPGVLSLLSISTICLVRHFKNRSSNGAGTGLGGLLAGSMFGVTGMLAFALYTVTNLTPRVEMEEGTIFALDTTGQTLSLKVVSLLFGLLVTGAVVLLTTVDNNLSSSSSSSPPASSSPTNEPEIQLGFTFHTNVWIGIFTIAFPSWISMSGNLISGLKTTSVALVVLQIVLGSTVVAGLWVKGDRIRLLDMRVLGLERRGGVGGSLELKRWDSQGSFLEA